jgi:hypothetical protein
MRFGASPPQKKDNMRLIAVMLALCVVAGAAAAQTWKEHPFPDQGFSVAFPTEPKIETTTYQMLDGRSVPARVYSVTQPDAVFRMTIADVPNPTNTDHAVIDQAVKALARGSQIKLDMQARVRAVYGRQVTLAAPDGSYSFVALFYYKNKLYQLEGKALATSGGDGRAEAMRFQQSLDFIDAGVRRPPKGQRKG